MSDRKLIGGLKDENGLYTPIKPPPPEVVVEEDLSIDKLLSRGLTAIDRIMKTVLREASSGAPSRESVMNLKDCMTMLHELKKKEQELLDDLSDEELEKFAK